MLALAAAAPGCGGRTFSCLEDGGCGSEGLCESDGWCSFPDGECSSGRRYAEFSGEGLGGLCVDSTPEDSSTGGSGPQAADTSGGTVSPGSSGVVTTLTEGTSSTDPVESGGGTTDSDPSTTCSDGACGTSMATASTGSEESAESSSEETGDPMPPCSGFFDDFDDGEFDPSWAPYGAVGGGGHVMTEADSELRWDFAAGLVEQRGLYRPFDTAVSSILIHASETPTLPGAQAQTVLLFREEGGPDEIHLVWSNDSVQVREGGDPVLDSPTFEWLEVRFEADEVLVSSSSNGTDFNLLATLASDYGGGGVQGLWLYGQTWTQAPAVATGAFGSIRVCVP